MSREWKYDYIQMYGARIWNIELLWMELLCTGTYTFTKNALSALDLHTSDKIPHL